MHAPAPTPLWHGQEAESPVVAVAVHAGHVLGPEAADNTALDDGLRLREEDPGTDAWAALFPSHLSATRSRFEVDLNRPRDCAVYLRPEDAWGHELWRTAPSAGQIQRALRMYDFFYDRLATLLDHVVAMFGRFVVYDLHSYNHRRDGADADPVGHPDVNVGTGSMDRARWAGVVQRFMSDLSSVLVPYGRGHLDVRENVCFRGRQVAQFVHERYPGTGCALAIEVKKFFMDEQTGVVDPVLHRAVGQALAETVPGVLDELGGNL